MFSVDETIVELLCECSNCPEGCACFSFRVTTEELEELKTDDDSGKYTCNRGHLITWNNVAATAKVDTAGYTIDRNHPLWIP